MPIESFAAAQQRVIARQEARRREAQGARSAHNDTVHQSPLSRLPFPFNKTAGPLTSFSNVLLESEGTKPAVRVGQVDAELLDEELLQLLKGQVGEALKYFGAHLQDDWAQEILLALRAALFKLSIWDNDASYGAALQGLRFSDSRTTGIDTPKPTKMQKVLYGLVTVMGRYGWDKWEDWLIQQEDGYNEPSLAVRRLSSITTRLSTLHSLTAFASFMVFLVNGRYRTLTDRLLRLRLVSPVGHVNREVSFEYLNRQLVWHAFTEFLLFLLPLVGISRWRRWLSRVWNTTKRTLQSKGESGANLITDKAGPLAFLPERTCAICYQDQNPTSASELEVLGANAHAGGGLIGSASTDIVNPYETVSCKCIYCFVCIATKIEAEEGSGWPCLRCGESVHKCRPWSGDVILAKTPNHKVGRKTVEFGNVSSVARAEPTESMRDDDLASELGSSQWQIQDKIDEDGG